MSAVNHAERRRRIAEVVIGVIARDGLDAATVRRIAAEVGFSTTVVTHYFADKQDLLLSAYHRFGEINRAKFDTFVNRDPPDLVGYLLSMSAVDPADRAFWRTYIAIWDRALRDEVFATELWSWIDEALQRLERFIGALSPHCVDPGRAAKRLLALVQGISTQMLFSLESWSPDAVRDAISTEVDLLLGRQVAKVEVQ